ncbi:hypothetical protein NDU88_001240 [Pleurodeles waltl]|uniref:Uncharacterized protein n=1 Tax=Pleurodeles waltl TaxID=8319 RepID=A0AAV7V9K9_PLEWA|nr:hypothetical protein NDU88_001240 [Pleurodeles waltl]
MVLGQFIFGAPAQLPLHGCVEVLGAVDKPSALVFQGEDAAAYLMAGSHWLRPLAKTHTVRKVHLPQQRGSFFIPRTEEVVCQKAGDPAIWPSATHTPPVNHRLTRLLISQGKAWGPLTPGVELEWAEPTLNILTQELNVSGNREEEDLREDARGGPQKTPAREENTEVKEQGGNTKHRTAAGTPIFATLGTAEADLTTAAANPLDESARRDAHGPSHVPGRTWLWRVCKKSLLGWGECRCQEILRVEQFTGCLSLATNGPCTYSFV